MAQADTIVFDKTGTLTHANPVVAQVVPFGGNKELEMLRLAGTGVAMGNGVPAVQAAADITIGPNDTDAIAAYLHTHILHAE